MSSFRAVALVHRVTFAEVVTRGRVVSLAVIAAVVAGVMWAVGRSGDVTDRVDVTVRAAATLGLAVVAPVVTLVFAAASLGEPREDGTLVYLWLRPMDRWPIVVGAWSGSVAASLPFTVVPVGVAAALATADTAVVTGVVVSSAGAVVVYSALFVLLGLTVENPIAWGLGYVLVWEGIVAGFGTFAARFAVRGYTRSMLTWVTDVDLDVADPSIVAALVVPGFVCIGVVLIGARRLGRLDVD